MKTQKPLLHLWEISRRKELDAEGEAVWAAPPEYVIFEKVRPASAPSRQSEIGGVEGHNLKVFPSREAPACGWGASLFS